MKLWVISHCAGDAQDHCVCGAFEEVIDTLRTAFRDDDTIRSVIALATDTLIREGPAYVGVVARYVLPNHVEPRPRPSTDHTIEVRVYDTFSGLWFGNLQTE